jgi:hypothetical protein
MKNIGQKIIVASHKGCFEAVDSGNFAALRFVELTVVEERLDVPGDDHPHILHKGYRAIGRIRGELSDSGFGCQWEYFNDSSSQPYQTWCLIPTDPRWPTPREIDNYLWGEVSILAGRARDTKAFADYVNSLYPNTLDNCYVCVDTPNRPREFFMGKPGCWFCKAAEPPENRASQARGPDAAS